ncbi:major outer membrane protein [Campylobacter upsaliensis]|uniref:Major outer membrane protein n=1 Tax=Campylobacter upsaliensis TaxID=28080 RepID=A0A5N7F7X6_CAMUP|nr:major outer membrane protein [Campylobacter upsaliensis]EAJ0878887.1 major outer membrane protein [Campylobacter upsaliensis]EAK0472130.1 major outer membrane protein [Campylobacter upsaliensis]EAV9673948.1 major outer membrane protein [Campylobacter upsaliensis]ECV9715440.1 major outer membrane protein [Campylobacter upsaliensis]EDP6896338.1 major outer membrane protein [Campylobacter upsaliensis]
MKLVKLSLVAALAAGAFSVANATPLEEAIKDIDVSGVLRYRYRAGNIDDKDTAGLANQSGLITDKQMHQYRAQINFNAAIADNFKAFVQLDYAAKDGGYGTLYGTNNQGNAVNDNESVTKEGLSVRQLYLTYTNEDFATSVIAGKQQLNTIWTDNGIDGLVGTGIKVLNNSFDGLTLAAFAVDSYNFDEQAGDITGLFTKPVQGQNLGLNSINVGNLYGGAAIASYEVFGGQLDSQLWGAYWDMVGAFYALDLAYGTTIFNDINWKLNAAYLGNYLDKTDIENGNFFGLRGTMEWNGFDASLGGLYYGDKDQNTLTVIEDQGNIGHLLAGQEIFYTQGSHLNGDLGENTFGYLTAGYTFNEVLRLGADFVYGGTKTSSNAQAAVGAHGGEKMEVVARVDYKYSPKLSFQAWYSYLNVDQDRSGEGKKDTVRLQALYKF